MGLFSRARKSKTRIAILTLSVAAATMTVGALSALPAAAAAGTSTLYLGEQLLSGQELVSPGGQMHLIMQSDGNLVLYAPGMSYRWASGTGGHPGAIARFQADGNFVVVAPGNVPVWSTIGNDGGGLGGTRIVLQDDGNLVQYTDASVPTWATYTYYFGWQTDAGSLLSQGMGLQSPNGQYTLRVETTDVVLYGPGGGVRWRTGSNGYPVSLFAVQTDGNLVVYTSGPYSWASGTQSSTPGFLRVQDDGNVVYYTPVGGVIWSANDAKNLVRPGVGTLDAGSLIAQFSATGGRFGAYSVGGNGCTTLTAWFIGTQTRLAYGNGNGGDVATRLVAANPGQGLAVTHVPQAGAIFSSRDPAWHAVAMCGAQPCGHTGIVVAVQGSQVTILNTYSALAATPPYVRLDVIAWNSSQQVDFVYVGGHMR